MEKEKCTNLRWMVSSLMWLFALGIFAQNDSLWTVSGRVVDEHSHKGMASVSVTDRHVATVTNEEGRFTIKLRQRPRRLSFSCVGYRPMSVNVGDGEMGGDNILDIGTVKLRTATVMLGEIIVQGSDARDLVMKAVDRIRKNYPSTPSLLRGFYRETVQKRSNFISISEAVVDVYKSSYDKVGFRDAVSIDKGRRLLSIKASDTLAVKLEGGPVLPVQFDVVKNPDIVLSPEELNLYDFRYLAPERAGERLQYVVEMRPRMMTNYPLFFGTLYIDQATLAFTRVELSLDMSDREKATQSLLRKKPLTLRFTPREMTVRVDYQTDEDGITRLSYLRSTIRFRCDWKRRLFKSNYTISSEMVVTDRQEGPDVMPIRRRDSFNSRDAFYDKVVFFDDPDFWGTDNIIEPTESLEKAVKKLRKKINVW